MTAFRCVPIETATVERFRRSGRDDAGNALRRLVAQAGGSYPCRHCLQLAAPSQEVLLGSYNLPRPRGIYWTPSPIFVHAEACERFEGDGEVAPIVRANPLVSVRAYDDEDQCLYDLGQVCRGEEVDVPLRRALDDAFPAPAGMNRNSRSGTCSPSRVPRACGDEPPTPVASA